MTDAQSNVGIYDEEEGVCTGCGSIVGAAREWCRECAPEVS